MPAPTISAAAVNVPSKFDAALVKQRARALGADLVGIASAATLNAFPPDPRWPQTPEIVLLESGTLAREFESAIKAPRFADRRG